METNDTLSLDEVHRVTSHLADAFVILDVMVKEEVTNKFIHIKDSNRRVKFSSIKHLIEIAKQIEYQDNDFFGRLSLFLKEKDGDKIYNILFPQNVLTEYCN